MRQLKPEHRKFFTMLYGELDKVSAFYNERETDCANRYRVLQDQLEELAQHRLRHEVCPITLAELSFNGC